MITESFAEGKHFFVAKILAKNMAENSETGVASENAQGINYSHYYNAYSILRLLFKKRND